LALSLTCDNICYYIQAEKSSSVFSQRGIKMFTRQEVIKLSGLTATRLSYLDRIDMVKPLKTNSTKKPTCLYTWEQLLELRCIFKLRENASLIQLRQAKAYLENCFGSDDLAEKQLISVNNVIYLKQDTSDELRHLLIEISGKNQGQITSLIFFSLNNILVELWEESRHHNIVDFSSRAKQKPLKVQKIIKKAA